MTPGCGAVPPDGLRAVAITYRDGVDLHFDPGGSKAVDRGEHDGGPCVAAHQARDSLGVVGFVDAAVVAVEDVKLGHVLPGQAGMAEHVVEPVHRTFALSDEIARVLGVAGTIHVELTAQVDDSPAGDGAADVEEDMHRACAVAGREQRQSGKVSGREAVRTGEFAAAPSSQKARSSRSSISVERSIG